MILLTDQSEIGGPERFTLRMLLEQTTFDEVQRECINTQIDECVTIQEFEEIEHYLRMNMIDDKYRIQMGLNYNQSDIKKAIRIAQ